MSDIVNIREGSISSILKNENEEMQYKYMLRANPYVPDMSYPCRIEGYVNNHLAGAVFTFPIEIVADGKVLEILSGSNFYVDKEYRKYELGLTIPEKWIERSGNILLGGISKEAKPVYKYYGFKFFEIPRFVYIVNPGFIIESMVPRFLSTVICPIASAICAGYYWLMSTVRKWKYRRFRVVLSDNTDKDYDIVEQIIEKDTHSYRENHDSRWLRWVMNYQDEYEKSDQELYFIYDKETPVGFFLIKYKYREELNGKYKDVVYATLLEWGTVGEEILSEQELCDISFTKFGLKADALAFISENADFSDRIPKLLYRRMGDLNMAVLLRDGDFPRYRDIKSWRIRPGVGDTSFC